MRKHWLDNLRWVTVLLVLLYHVFYFYNNKGVFGGIGGFAIPPKRILQICRARTFSLVCYWPAFRSR